MEQENLRKQKFDYKWVIVAISFLMVMICLGFCSSGKSLYITAITDALKIKRSAFSINDSCRFVATAIINMFFGTLVSKFGTKKLIGAGFLCLIASSLIYSMAENIFVFYIGGTLLGVGLSWTTTTMVGSIINKWCKENKGTIMGAVLAANGLGGAIATQIVTPIIYQEGNPFGYQTAYKLVALILFVVGALVMILYRENPKGVEKTEAVVHKKKARGEGWIGVDFATAARKPYFYIAIFCIFCTGMVLNGMNGISTPHLQNVGLDIEYVAAMVSIHSLVLALFKFLTGFIYDRAGLRITMNICFTTAVIVMFMLSMVTNTPAGRVLAFIYEIFSSLALPLETIMLPIYANDMFGQKSYDKILGIFVSVTTAGYAVGSPLANFCYDFFGTYNVALVASGILMIAITIIMQFVLSKANKEKAAILADEAKRAAKEATNAVNIQL